MYQQLFDVLEPAMIDSCRVFLDMHKDESIYSVALYTSGEYSYLFATFSTKEGLKKTAAKYMEDDFYQEDWGTLDVATKELKWSPCDSPYHSDFEGKFEQADEMLNSIWQSVDEDSDEAYRETCKEIHETAIAVLAKVRDSDLFDRNEVVFNLLMGDQSEEERLLNAESLNSDAVLEKFRNELEINDAELEELRTGRWSN